MPLDETRTAGETGHLSDHNDLHAFRNDFDLSGATEGQLLTVQADGTVAAENGASAVVSPANDGTNGLFGVPGVALDPNDSRTDSFVGGITYYFPFEMSQAGTVDTAIFEVTSAATGGATARVAIATADGDWQPDALVVDLGEKAIDATGVPTYTPTQALSAGRHLLAYRGSATATLRNLQGAPLNFGGIRGDGSFGPTPWINQIRVTEAYGAFADPPTAWDSATAGASGFRQPVLLGWT